MTVHHRHHVRTHGVDGAVDVALEIQPSPFTIDDFAIQTVDENIAALHRSGRLALRQQESLRIEWMASADVAEAIHHLLAIKNAIRRDEIVDHVRGAGEKIDSSAHDVPCSRVLCGRVAGYGNAAAHDRLRSKMTMFD